MAILGRYSRLVKPPNSFEPMNSYSWVQYMGDVHTQIVTPIFHAQRSTSFGVLHNTPTVLVYNQRVVDTHDWYSTTTGRYTPRISGYYLCTAEVNWDQASVDLINARYTIELHKNGVSFAHFRTQADYSYDPVDTLRVTGLCWLNGKTDYINVSISQTSGATRSTTATDPDCNFFFGHRISP